MPESPVTAELADEVGRDWVLRYSPPLTASAIHRAKVRLRSAPLTGRPDLAARAWEVSTAAHIAVYTKAVEQQAAI